jgi:DNA-directed RNA polymerase subunit alpha
MLKHIPLPKRFITDEIESGKKAKVIIEPCFPGYGLTLGNSLRRVMLSSLPGGAITAVKIKGVKHEFSTLENVPEDILELILNLKNVRFKVYSDEPVILTLKAEGKGKVTVKDIEKSLDAEPIDNGVVIATLTDETAKMEMEFTVVKGIGYLPVEEQERGKGEIGLITVDAIFTPVLNVGLQVETTRVGQKTDYDKIVLEVETDGTISPYDAVKKAAEILTNQFTWIMEGGLRVIEEVDITALPPEFVPEVTTVEPAETEAGEEAETNEVVTDSAEATEGEEDKPKKRGRPKKIEE